MVVRRFLFLACLLLLIAPAAGNAAAISVRTPEHPNDAQLLDVVQHKAFAFFWNETHAETGLTKDRARNLGTAADSYTVASIAATGYALASLPVAVERKWVGRKAAYERARRTLRFLHDRLPNVHGFYYHFVDWATGERVWKCELSSIDTALLVLGALAAGRYWRGTEVERLAEAIYARVDFRWMQRGGDTGIGRSGVQAFRRSGRGRRSGVQAFGRSGGTDSVRPERLNARTPERRERSEPPVFLWHGWKPETGWIPARWARYDEASFLYLLAMGSPTHAIGPEGWDRWEVPSAVVEGYPVFGGPHPIFFAQMAPGYYDLRGIRDRQGRDWWTNFRNDHLANHAYCARRAGRVKTYSETIWGITACDQPPPVVYGAQAPEDGKNDGTVAPTAMIASFFITPDLGGTPHSVQRRHRTGAPIRAARASLRALWEQHRDRTWGRYGFSNAFNVDKDWYDPDVIGIDLGMMLLNVENHRTGLLWRLMRSHPAVKKGMSAAGMRRASRAS